MAVQAIIHINTGTEQNANMALSDRLGDLIVETFISFLCGKFVVGGPVAEKELFKAVYYELKKPILRRQPFPIRLPCGLIKIIQADMFHRCLHLCGNTKVTLYPKANFGDAANAEVRNTYKCKMTV